MENIAHIIIIKILKIIKVLYYVIKVEKKILIENILK